MIFSAAGYDVQCEEEREELSPDTSRNSSLSLCGEMSPHHYGARETCSLTTDQWDTRLYCGVLAYDELGNRGQTSNIVQVDIPSRPSTAAPALEEEEEEEVDKHILRVKMTKMMMRSPVKEHVAGEAGGRTLDLFILKMIEWRRTFHDDDQQLVVSLLNAIILVLPIFTAPNNKSPKGEN